LRRGLRLEQPPQQSTTGKAAVCCGFAASAAWRFGPPLGHLAVQSADEIDDRLGGRVGLLSGGSGNLILSAVAWCAGLLTGIFAGPIRRQERQLERQLERQRERQLERQPERQPERQVALLNPSPSFWNPCPRSIGLPRWSGRCLRPWRSDRLPRRLRPAGAAKPINQFSHHPARIGRSEPSKSMRGSPSMPPTPTENVRPERAANSACPAAGRRNRQCQLEVERLCTSRPTERRTAKCRDAVRFVGARQTQAPCATFFRRSATGTRRLGFHPRFLIDWDRQLNGTTRWHAAQRAPGQDRRVAIARLRRDARPPVAPTGSVAALLRSEKTSTGPRWRWPSQARYRPTHPCATAGSRRASARSCTGSTVHSLRVRVSRGASVPAR